MRNRETIALAIIYAGCSLVMTIYAGVHLGLEGALYCLLATSACAIPVFLERRYRYREIARLASELDEHLHGRRQVNFASMREGELAVLSSQLDKVVSRLAITVEELEQERTALSDGLSDISHQIKTPLTSISLLHEFVLRRLTDTVDPIDPQEAHELAQRLRQASCLQERVQWLVSALLRLARIDAGTIALAHEWVDARELISTAYAPLAIGFDIADVSLCTHIDSACGFLGDLHWTAEALENVLKNCLEHTPSGGRVDVEAYEDTLAFRIRITDTGTGISPHDLPQLFERFYRGSEESRGTGAGIGLALARSLLTAQGGRITATNNTDAYGHVCGARFDIVFFKGAL